MKNATHSLILLGFIVLTPACVGHPKVVEYGPMSARGGYQEEEIEPGVWRVFARSGGEKGADYARNMAQYRAAEMLKARGFSWVQILKEFPTTELSEDLGGGRRRVLREDVQLTVRGAYQYGKPEDCRQTGGLRCWSFTPDLMMKQARKRLKFKRMPASGRINHP